MAKKIGISVKGIEKNIFILKNSDVIERIGSKKSGYWSIIDKE